MQVLYVLEMLGSYQFPKFSRHYRLCTLFPWSIRSNNLQFYLINWIFILYVKLIAFIIQVPLLAMLEEYNLSRQEREDEKQRQRVSTKQHCKKKCIYDICQEYAEITFFLDLFIFLLYSLCNFSVLPTWKCNSTFHNYLFIVTKSVMRWLLLHRRKRKCKAKW